MARTSIASGADHDHRHLATTEEVFAANEIRTLIAHHLGVDVKLATDEARFADDLGADWFDRLELLILIEDYFDVEIPDENVHQIETVGDLISLIESVNNERQRRGADPVTRKLFGPSLARAVKPIKQQEDREQAAFFLRLANDAMRGLSSRCAVTRQRVELPIYADHATLTRIRSNSVRFQCPHCGAEHQMKVEVACAEAGWIKPHQANDETHQHTRPGQDAKSLSNALVRA